MEEEVKEEVKIERKTNFDANPPRKRKQSPRQKNKHWAKFRIEQVADTSKNRKRFFWRIIACNGQSVCESNYYTCNFGPGKVITSLIKAIKNDQFKIVEGFIEE